MELKGLRLVDDRPVDIGRSNNSTSITGDPAGGGIAFDGAAGSGVGRADVTGAPTLCGPSVGIKAFTVDDGPSIWST